MRRVISPLLTPFAYGAVVMDTARTGTSHTVTCGVISRKGNSVLDGLETRSAHSPVQKSSWMQCQLPYSGSEASLSGTLAEFDFASVAPCVLGTLFRDMVATWASLRFAPELSTVGAFDMAVGDPVPVTFDCRKPENVVISAFMLAGTNDGKSKVCLEAAAFEY